MPYRRVGRTVEVQKGASWRVLKVHPTTEKAAAHLTALKINVEHKK